MRSIFIFFASHGEGGTGELVDDSLRGRFSGVNKSDVSRLDLRLVDNRLDIPENNQNVTKRTM